MKMHFSDLLRHHPSSNMVVITGPEILMEGHRHHHRRGSTLVTIEDDECPSARIKWQLEDC